MLFLKASAELTATLFRYTSDDARQMRFPFVLLCFHQKLLSENTLSHVKLEMLLKRCVFKSIILVEFLPA